LASTKSERESYKIEPKLQELTGRRFASLCGLDDDSLRRTAR
jgi:hypothetical protein